MLEAFQSYAPPTLTVQAGGCLGQCGSGPMVLILPEATWYCRIAPEDVPTILHQHLQRGQIVREKLYPKFHPAHKNQSIAMWLIAISLCIGLLLLLGIAASQSEYL